MTDIPHLQFPLQLAADGSMQTTEQDTLEDVRQCVHGLLRTPLGARPLAPTVGIEDPTFSQAVDPELLAMTLEEQEDRAIITVEGAEPDKSGEVQLQVIVELADQGL